MARPLRIEYPGAVYHVLNRGTARQRVFREPPDYQHFLGGLAEAHLRWGVEVFAYCLMSTHYHLCLRTPSGNLSRVMRHVDGIYTQRFNRAHGRDGPLFRGRYQAILVETERYLSAVVRYIHRNPMEAGVVRTLEEYPWTSHHSYLSPKRAPRWLQTAEVVGPFGSRTAFHRFVLAGNDASLERFYIQGKQSPILGGETFRDWVRRKVKAPDREHPREQRRALRPSEEAVYYMVAKAYGVPVAALWKGRRGRSNEARKIAMYFAHRLCDLTLRETAKRFGVESYGVIGWACTQIRQRIAGDKRFRARIEGIEKRICQQKT